MASEKEYNGHLFDQLELLDRIKRVAKSSQSIESILEAIELEESYINRKLYNPSPRENAD